MNEFKVKKGLIVQGSGSTLLDIQGSQGQLFSITDDLTGTLFSVSDISGVPILDVDAGGEVNIDGNLHITDNVGIGTTSPDFNLDINGDVRIEDSHFLRFGGNVSNTEWAIQHTGTNLNFAEVGVADARLYLKAGGNVGIGTASPTKKISVTDTSGTFEVAHFTTNSGGCYTRNTDSIASVETGVQGGKWSARTGNVQRLVIDSTGKVSIGSTVASHQLEVVGDIGVSRSSGIVFTGSTFSGSSITANTSNTLILATRLAGSPYTQTEVMHLTAAGDVGIGTNSPSYKLDIAGEGRFTGNLRCLSLIQTSQRDKKKEITDIKRTTGKKVLFKQFKYIESIDPSGVLRYGAIAEDIQGEYPELVYTDSDGELGVNYIDLLIKRVAELEQELEDATQGLTINQTVAIDNKGNTQVLRFVNGLLQEPENTKK
tara:strand:+ start:1230 stop:2516 length:1287 start_codon:yes stop_codon:yes gene_type:complete